MGTKATTYLGIDGGGTRCRARIEDENGSLLGAANSGPATTRIGFEKAWRSIMVVMQMCEDDILDLVRTDVERTERLHRATQERSLPLL